MHELGTLLLRESLGHVVTQIRINLTNLKMGADEMAAEVDLLKTVLDTFLTKLPELEQKVHALADKASLPPLISHTELGDLHAKLSSAVHAIDNILGLIQTALAPPAP